MNRPARTILVAVVGLALTALAPASAAWGAAGQADPATAGGAGPTVTVDPPAARPGERVAVTVSGFESVTATVAVCGNLARRGSADCDVRSSEGLSPGLGGGEDATWLYVTEPPAPCPCVVRAANSSHDEVAFAPLTIIGVPEAPIVEPSTGGPLVSVSIDARRSPEGLAGAARAALGGRTRYEVAVSVRNLTGGPLHEVRVSGTATRSGNMVASFSAGPRPLEPGESHTYRRQVDVPAPALGTLTWEAAASGAGPPVRSEQATRSVPVALLALVAVFVGDLTAIAVRWRRRRCARSRKEASAGPPAARARDDDATDGPADDVMGLALRDRMPPVPV